MSTFSKIHSSIEKDYKSANTITFDAMKQGASLFGKATFCMDRGYDDNKRFLKLDALNQDYVIRLKSNRKLLYHNKWTFATELRNRRKGKITGFSVVGTVKFFSCTICSLSNHGLSSASLHLC